MSGQSNVISSGKSTHEGPATGVLGASPRSPISQQLLAPSPQSLESTIFATPGFEPSNSKAKQQPVTSGEKDDLVHPSAVNDFAGHGLDEISTPIFSSWTQQGKRSQPVSGGLVGIDSEQEWDMEGFDDSQLTENENTADGEEITKTPPLKESQPQPVPPKDLSRAGSRRERLSLTPTLDTRVTQKLRLSESA